MLVISCGEVPSATTEGAISNSKSSPNLLAKGAAIGAVPTSVKLNFGSGYWHIASGFNVESTGDFKEYDGTWLQMNADHELVWGKLDEELGRGAWGWNEALEHLWFISDTSKEFFIGEWKTNNKGDIYICIGNTPSNPRSTQFKLVRRQSKSVSE